MFKIEFLIIGSGRIGTVSDELIRKSKNEFLWVVSGHNLQNVNSVTYSTRAWTGHFRVRTGFSLTRWIAIFRQFFQTSLTFSRFFFGFSSKPLSSWRYKPTNSKIRLQKRDLRKKIYVFRRSHFHWLIWGKSKISSFFKFGVNLKKLEFNLHFSLGFEFFKAFYMISKHWVLLCWEIKVNPGRLSVRFFQKLI
jgi:hypothetical protein